MPEDLADSVLNDTTGLNRTPQKLVSKNYYYYYYILATTLFIYLFFLQGKELNKPTMSF